jgi:CheY-like chemotaxis protein
MGSACGASYDICDIWSKTLLFYNYNFTPDVVPCISRQSIEPALTLLSLAAAHRLAPGEGMSSRLTDEPSESTGPVVLVVEDVVLVRMLLSDYLRKSGYQVLEASDGEEAIRVIKNLPVQVVVSDVHMPGATTDGLALARWIREHRPELKIILASGVFSTLDPADSQFHEGALLQKPFRVHELEQRLRAVLGATAPGN